MTPLPSPGASVSITTGLPLGDDSSQNAKDKAARKFHDTLQESYNLSAELQTKSPLAKAVFEQYQKRLAYLASQDPVCLALGKIVSSWRHDLEIAPVMAEKEAIRVFGPQIGPLLQEKEAASD